MFLFSCGKKLCSTLEGVVTDSPSIKFPNNSAVLAKSYKIRVAYINIKPYLGTHFNIRGDNGFPDIISDVMAHEKAALVSLS